LPRLRDNYAVWLFHKTIIGSLEDAYLRIITNTTSVNYFATTLADYDTQSIILLRFT
jgi:hypothetical protein